MNTIHEKYECSKSKIIKMVGMVPSSYYRKPSLDIKGNIPSKYTYHQSRGFVISKRCSKCGKRDFKP